MFCETILVSYDFFLLDSLRIFILIRAQIWDLFNVSRHKEKAVVLNQHIGTNNGIVRLIIYMLTIVSIFLLL